jgi:hypothetical protein
MDNREARHARHVLVTAAIVLILGLAVPPVSVRAHNPTVKVSVDASEFFGNPLTYHWRDGRSYCRSEFADDRLDPAERAGHTFCLRPGLQWQGRLYRRSNRG